MDLGGFDCVAFFPRQLQGIISMFRKEVEFAIKQVIKRLDLVSKDEYLVQKRMLHDAKKDVAVLKKRLEQCGCDV